MENLAADYLNFARPPLAPVFRPTEKEFRDPIAYVAKIRAEAEPYGVVKIIPPEVGWILKCFKNILETKKNKIFLFSRASSLPLRLTRSDSYSLHAISVSTKLRESPRKKL